MKESIHDTTNGLDYTLVSDHYLPNLTVAAPAEQHLTGRWGRLHKKYLEEHHPVRYNQLVTEALKAADQLEWVRRMNSIRNRAEEIIWQQLFK